MSEFDLDQLKEARFALDSTLSKCEKILPKLAERSSQHTLLSRRIRALKLAIVLIEDEIEKIIEI